jgi:hypothetical protein
MLLEQIEEQKRHKDEEKRRRFQEEIEEEKRIKREIEVLNARENGEVNSKVQQQRDYKQMLDEETERRTPKQSNNHQSRPPRSDQSFKSQNDSIPPEFQDLANSVEQQQKRVKFEDFPNHNFPNIPKGQDMFKTELKGTNTQRLTEIQLNFQKEINGLENQLKKVHDELRGKEKSEFELQKLRLEMQSREQQSNNQQAKLQEQLIELMKGYQDQIAYLTKMKDQAGTNNIQRPGSNRSMGGKRDTRSDELKNFEKNLFSGPQPQKQAYNNSNVMIDFNNPSDQPYIKPSPDQNQAFNYNKYAANNQKILDLTASLNAESQMVPFMAGSQSKISPDKRPPKFYAKSLESTGELGGTNGSVSRKINRELDDIEKMNQMNEEDFPGSLKGTRHLENIPEEDIESLRNTSNFEDMPNKYLNENDHPNKSFDNSLNIRLNDSDISDPKFHKGSMKMDKFEGFPELPEYEGIQKSYVNSNSQKIKSYDSNIMIKSDVSGLRMRIQDEEDKNQLEQENILKQLEASGSLGTRSIDFDELQQKLAQKTDYPIYQEPAKPERK